MRLKNTKIAAELHQKTAAAITNTAKKRTAIAPEKSRRQKSSKIYIMMDFPSTVHHPYSFLSDLILSEDDELLPTQQLLLLLQLKN